MKKLAFLLTVVAMLATSSQAFAQTGGGADGNIQLPAVQVARSAFYASLNAYQQAQNEANLWESMRGYHPNAEVAATNWQVSANCQYQALVRLHYVWTELEEIGYIMPIDRGQVEEAVSYSWYSMTRAASTGTNHPAVSTAEYAYEKIDELGWVIIW